MMDQARFSLRARLLGGFFSLAALTVILALVALYQIHHMAGLTRDIYEHPLTVGYTIRDVRGYAWNIGMLVARADESLTSGQIDLMEDKIAELDRQAMDKIALLGDRYLGSQSDVATLREGFAAWKPLREEKLHYLRQKTWPEHEEDYTLRANRFADDLVAKCQAVADFSASKARSFYDAASAQESLGWMVTLIVMSLLMLTKLGVGLLVTNSIIKPLGIIVARMRDIAAGDFSQDLDLKRKDEIGVLAEAFRDIQKSLREKTSLAESVAAGDFSHTSLMAGDRDTLGAALSRMTTALSRFQLQSARMDWIKSGLNALSARLTGETDSKSLANGTLSFLAPYLGAQIGTVYLAGETGKLILTGSYAVREPESLAEAFSAGEGLVGQAFVGKNLIQTANIPDGYLHISSSLGESPPRHILALPLLRENEVVGVMELGSFEQLSEEKVEFLGLASESMAVAFDSLRKQDRVRELLERTQAQATQLLEQQEELRATNEELEEHTQALRSSEEELKQQQEQLQVLNEELEENVNALEQQRNLVLEKNTDLERVSRDIERKAAELEVSSRYKSEFLANMSHELRTPLNSLLLLSRSLRDNGSGHLAGDEVEAAGIIYKNGNDLLGLINDILDLSKIEAGKMTLNLEAVNLADTAESVAMDFRHVAEEKGLFLAIDQEAGMAASILSDPQRLGQILRNLVSNAVKFTEKGGVTVSIHRPSSVADLNRSGLSPDQAVAVTVADTGIGIPADKHREIFEAFHQVDGSTSRRYGGTGLGLSITRELARLLGGEVALVSEPGEGSAFTVYLPIVGPAEFPAAAQPVALAPLAEPFVPEPSPRAPTPVPSIPDDREEVLDTDKAVLIIEDDPDFAKILSDLGHDKGFKTLNASTGEEGLALAGKYLPMAVILDIRLPGINGWTVLNSLKKSPATRHIPVHVISVHDGLHEALNMGAMGFLTKPVGREDLDTAIERIEAMVDKKVKDLLLVEDNADLRKGIKELVGDLGVNVTEVGSGQRALEAIRRHRFDCMILDLGLEDMNGFELLKRLEDEQEPNIPPVIVYTGKELTKDEEKELRRHSESIIVKGARSEGRLLDEVTLFLHRMVSSLPKSKQRMILNLHNRDALLEGKNILVVDDDMRNLFAVSRILEEKGMRVRKAEDGANALEALEADPAIDLVLLDIMMPVMDGYETLKRIREQSRFSRLPVIALTAKAMKEDREKCISAGASDYLSKPVDVDKLLSMMRVWLYGK